MSQTPGRFLVVKLADIGDAVLSLPAIQALRRARPDAQIDVLTTEAGANVFRLSPDVDDVICFAKSRFDRVFGMVAPSGLLEVAGLSFRLRRARYDAVILLHHLTTQFGARKFSALSRVAGAPIVAGLDNGRGDFLTHRATDYGFGVVPEWQYGLQVMESIGVSPEPGRPQLELSADATGKAHELLRSHGVGGQFALVHTEVGDFSPARAWPDHHFAKLVDLLHARSGIAVVLVGVDSARPGLEEIATTRGVTNLTGQTSFQELCALVEMADLVIGADSAVSHLAGAYDRPAISLFGPSNVDAWAPFGASVITPTEGAVSGSKSVALHLDMPCSPCIYTGFRLGRPYGCPSRSCMHDLQPEDVYHLATSLLSENAD